MAIVRTKTKEKKFLMDKIIALAIFSGNIVVFILSVSTEVFVTWENIDFIRIINLVVGSCSIFYFFLSLFFGKKFEDVFNRIAGGAKKEIDTLYEFIKSNMLKQSLYESRILYEYEKDLDDYLQLKDNNYAMIIIVTNYAEFEDEKFADIIRKNILDNHQYIYITPYEDEEYIKNLRSIVLGTANHTHEYRLEAAFQKNIIHYQDKSFFDLMPDYTDLIVYKKVRLYNVAEAVCKGFYSYQNGPIEDSDLKFFYYTKMNKDTSKRIAINLATKFSFSNNKFFKTWVSDKLEQRFSEVDNGMGLFCKENISAGTILLRIGGDFFHKEKLPELRKKNNDYLQIDDDYVISSKREYTTLPINHSCRLFNCGMKNEIEIHAIREIAKGEEILLNYAFADLNFAEFDCSFGCNNCFLKNRNVLPQLFSKKYEFNLFSPYLVGRIINYQFFDD